MTPVRSFVRKKYDKRPVYKLYLNNFLVRFFVIHYYFRVPFWRDFLVFTVTFLGNPEIF